MTRFIRLLPLLYIAAPLAARADDNVPAAKPYAEVAKALDAFVRKEVEDKRIPSMAVALVDDQQVVWAQGFGFADPKAKTPATAGTVYRVGSVSKLFTDLAVMQLAEKGTLDLDAPVTKFLPEFKPVNRTDKAITLRQLMSHRSGLVRESPIGNYFDPDGPSLAKSIRSLNQTELVYAPEERTKYSNAGVGTVGLALEEIQGRPFGRYLEKALLVPLGMGRSSFLPDEAVTKHLAKAAMWTYHGREFPAPTFELGTPPAGCLYTTVTDLGKFLSMLFARGKAGDEVIVQPETLEAMYKPQFAKEGEKTGFGLGFMVSQFEGRRRVGHGGAIYGFATDLSALPEDKLGVVVVASLDCANAVSTHVADEALRLMLAAKAGKPLPKIETTEPLKPEDAKKLAGRYKGKSRSFDLVEREGRLYLWPLHGGFRAELRARGDTLIADDRLVYGTKVERAGDGKLRINADTYEKVEMPMPKPLPEKWAGLIGEYGWDHNVLYILEKDGKLHALIEWFFLYPLEEEKENVFKFPDHGLYHGEKLVFTRDKDGRATRVEAASVVFDRRKLDGEGGKTFKIKPVKPVDELRREAEKAKPPEETGRLAKSDLVELIKLDDSIKLDIRYATDNNFLGTPVYKSAKAYLQRPAAEALVRVHKRLKKDGYGLMVFDGYRPWSVTKVFWDATPEHFHVFVADPSKGSRHNRGCAVDLTLFALDTGKPVEMVGGYDEMSDRSYPEYQGGTSLQQWHRDLLRRAMEAEGFAVYEAEWWHFDYKDWKSYAIQNIPFEELRK